MILSALAEIMKPILTEIAIYAGIVAVVLFGIGFLIKKIKNK